MTARRRDTDLASRYGKDPEDEAFLSRLNAILAPHEETAYVEREEKLPTLHIIGCPRSGTTLLNQMLATHLSVGCITNLVAAFWAAPCFGIALARRFARPAAAPSYASDYGRTQGVHEPHEFGYFWASMLGYREMAEPSGAERARVDWTRFRRVMTNMTAASGMPIVFKSFMLAWYVREVERTLPRSCFVWIRRDPVQNALSLLRARREYGGSESNWISLRPGEYAWLRHEPAVRQVAGQVVFLERALAREIDRAEGRNVLELSYEDLCAEPGPSLERIVELLNRNGAAVEWTSEPSPALDPRCVRGLPPEEERAVRRAVGELARVSHKDSS